MSFVLSLGEIRGGEKVGEFYVRGDEYHKEGNNLLIKKGEFFDYDKDKKVFRYLIEEGMSIYFYDGGNFILSDDFWEIVNLIEPSASDIDIQSVKEKGIFHFSLFNKTIVKYAN